MGLTGLSGEEVGVDFSEWDRNRSIAARSSVWLRGLSMVRTCAAIGLSMLIEHLESAPRCLRNEHVVLGGCSIIW